MGWQRCDDLKKSYLALRFEGGYRDDRTEWSAIQDRMVEAMVRLDEVIRPLVPRLREISPENEEYDDREGGNSHGG